MDGEAEPRKLRLIQLPRQRKTVDQGVVQIQGHSVLIRECQKPGAGCLPVSG